MQDRRETLNSFIWGSDGWLYGCHGVFTHSTVGKPGTGPADRVNFNAGWWRYHPLRHRFELFAEGGSNQWGIGFDDHGQAFATACVIPHLWHVIQGGRYQRQAGEHTLPHTYDDIRTIADHKHASAHGGARVYLADNFPPEYRHRLVMGNIHQHAILTDALERKGSGFVGRHGPDVLQANDKLFIGFNLEIGPEGSVYVIDWYDRDICGNAVDQQQTGRLYRITFGDVKSPVGMNLALRSDAELVALHLHANDWYCRQARRLLQERAARGKLDAATIPALEKLLAEHPEPARRLRALWSLHVVAGLKPDRLLTLLTDQNEYLRCWAIQLLCEEGSPPALALARFAMLAASDPSPVVRLYLAAALQRLPVESRWEIAAALVSHAADATDHNLPLMIWFGSEPLFAADPGRALALARSGRIPLLRNFAARRLAARPGDPDLTAVVDRLSTAGPDAQRDLLFGTLAGLKVRTACPLPAGWSDVHRRLLSSDDKDVREASLALAVLFGDPQALVALRERMLATGVAKTERVAALSILADKREPGLAPALHRLLADSDLRGTAIRRLAEYADDRTPAAILERYAELTPAERRDAVTTLSSRAGYALALLDALETKTVDRADVSAFVARQLHALGDPRVSARLREVWGAVRDSPEAKREQIATLKARLTPGELSRANVSNGRLLFGRICQQCHVLYGEGGVIGPDITGSNRADLDYILANLVDPSAEIGRGYQMKVVATTDGRVLTGLIPERSATGVVVQTATERVVVPVAEVESETTSPLSMMPEGQLDAMTTDQIRDLIGYLRTTRQVPLPTAGP